MIGTASSRISSHARTQCPAGAAARSAATSVVLPAPGSPEIAIRLRSCISTRRNAAPSRDNESRSTRSSSVTLRTTYRRRVADSWSPTGGMAAVRRAVPPSTRACTIGCLVLSCRSVTASMRSTTCRFSSSLVGTVSPRRRPDPSRYDTRAPSMKISSTSRRAISSVRAPKSVIERSTRSAISAGSTSGSSSPSSATR